MSPLRAQEPDRLPETNEMTSCRGWGGLFILSCDSHLAPRKREGLVFLQEGGRGVYYIGCVS